jgi:hypothetical protein
MYSTKTARQSNFKKSPRSEMPASDKSASGRLLLIVLWACLLGIVVFLQIINIHRDGYLNVSQHGFWESDEGAYAYNATALIRYNEMVTPGVMNCSTHCPVLTFIQYLFFRLFGISLASSHIFGVCFFAMAQILFLLFFWRKGIPCSGIVMLMVLLLNIQIFSFSRSSIAEALSGVFIAMATILIFSGSFFTKKLWLRSLLLGILSIIVIFTKLYMLTLACAIMMFLLVEAFLQNRRSTDRLKYALRTVPVFLSVIIAGIVFYVIFIVWKYYFEWGVFSSSNFDDRFIANPLIVVKLVGRLFLSLVFQDGLSVLFLCAVASVPILISNIRMGTIDVFDKIQIWGWCLFLMRFLTVGIQEYQAPRYLFPLAWSLLIIDTVFIHKLYLISSQIGRNRLVRMLIYTPAVIVPVSLFLAVNFPVNHKIEIIFIFFLLTVSIALLIWFSRNNKKAAFIGSLAILLAFKSYTFQFHITTWMRTCTDSYYRALKDIHDRLPSDCIVMGRMAGFVALEHPCRAYWPDKMRPDVRPPDFIIFNGGSKEVSSWASINPFLKNLLFDPDRTWKPLKYDIMGNYYTQRPTWVYRMRK